MILYFLSWVVVAVAAIAVVIFVLWFLADEFTDWTLTAAIAAGVIVLLAACYIVEYNAKKSAPTTQVEKL